MSDIKTIKLPEKFDFSYHKVFMDTYQGWVGDDSIKEIVVDFTHVKYLDSSALGMLVLLTKKFDTSRVKMKIHNAKGAAKEIVEIASMSILYDIQ